MWFLKKIFSKILGTPKKDDNCLRNFTQNIYWGNSLTPHQARKNLEEGILELVDLDGNHSSNGLLLTDDGYFITSAHCLIGSHALRVILKDQSYRITEVCSLDARNDIGLAKINSNGNSTSRVYKFFNPDNFSLLQAIPIVVLTKQSGCLILKGGYTCGLKIDKLTTIQKVNLYDQIELNITVRQGDSGGVVSTSNYEIVGIVNTATISVSSGHASQWHKALELIVSYKP